MQTINNLKDTLSADVT